MNTEYLLRFDADPCEVYEWCAKNFPTDSLSPYSGWNSSKHHYRQYRWRLNLQGKKEIILNREKDAAWFLLRWS